jgi:hypothetical protein
MLGLSFLFPLFVGIMSFPVTLVIGSNSDIFSFVNAEEGQQEHQLLRFISSSLDNNGGYDLYYGAAFIKELKNFIKNFEYTFDLKGNQIFPNNNIRQDIVSEYKSSEYKSSEYNIGDLNYELLGFEITASDIKIHVDPKKIDDTKTRIDIPLLLAKDIKVSNGGLINLSYDAVDLGSVYGVYDKATDKKVFS